MIQPNIEDIFVTSNVTSECDGAGGDDSQTNTITAEQKFRAAKSPGDFLLVFAGLIGEKKPTAEILSAFVDARIADAELPHGVSRSDVKAGIVTTVENIKEYLFPQ